MKEFVREIVAPIFYIVLFVFCLFIGLFACISMVEKNQCASYEQVTGRNTQWRFFGGCYVQGRDKWYTMDEYKSVIAAKESLTIEEME